MLRTLLIATAFAVLVAVGLLALVTLRTDSVEAGAPVAIDIAIDMDTTGNDARLTGGADIQDCGEITGTGNLDIDVILPPPGLDPTDGLQAWQFDLNYDPAVVSVTAEDQSFLLAQAAGSITFSLSSGSPGVYNSAAADIGAPPGIEPAGVYETGPGVLARFTLTGVAQGTSALTLTGVIPADETGTAIPVNNIFDATVSVDETCVSTVPAPDVRITGLDCNADPEVVRIQNVGTATQNLAGWQLRSDPTSQTLDLSAIGKSAGKLEPGEIAAIRSNSNAGATDTTTVPPQYLWDKTEKFRDADTTDFAQLLDGTATEVDKLNCAAGEVVALALKGHLPLNDEDGIASCDDGVDNGGDTTADAADSDCSQFNGQLEEDGAGAGTCSNGIDDGADTVKDSGDSDCREFQPTLDEDNIGTCNDGVNNDPASDAVTDKNDTDCMESTTTEGPPLDEAPNLATETDPVEVTVFSPNAGAVRIVEGAITQTAPAGLNFVGFEIDLQAPAASAAEPLIVRFILDSSILPPDANDLKVFKAGAEVPACTGAAGTASPDPCVSARLPLAGGDSRVTVLTSGASLWNFGAPPQPTPTPGPGTTPTPTGTPDGAGGPGTLPPTGDSIPVEDGGGTSTLTWLLVGLGSATAIGAAGYVLYGRRRNRFIR